MPKYIPIAEIRAMTDEELVELSQERNSRGKYSQNAENAMKVRRERSGSAQWWGISRKTTFKSTRQTECGSNMTKKFK